MKTQQLFAWIGKTDLDASGGKEAAGLGPIGQTVEERGFEVIHLLSNYPAEKGRKYVAWLKKRFNVSASLHRHDLSSPVEFGEIYEAAIKTIDKESAPEDTCRAFQISSGTNAMAAIWLLLGRTSRRGELLQSSREEGVKTVSLPFEFSADYLPIGSESSGSDIEQLSQELPPESPEFGMILQQSEVMEKVKVQARRMARFDVPVLILGETGTGKELFAEAIYSESARSSGPFIAVNCGAISKELVESELFGHVRGAFTGAHADHEGHIARADGGILFLDEVGELPLPAQVKLLRVLQEKQLQRVGDSETSEVDFRVIAATNRPLIADVAAGRFREDLFYRVSGVVLQLPPLRQRVGDMKLLTDHFLAEVNREYGEMPTWVPKGVSAAARNRLSRHDWPGNVRELANTIRRIAILTHGKKIEEDLVEEALLPIRGGGQGDGILHRDLGEDFDLRQVVSEVRKHYLERALKQTADNKAAAARLVGAPSPQTFGNWVRDELE